MKCLKRILFSVILFAILALPGRVFAASLLSSLEVDGIGALNISSRNTFNITLTTSLDYATINATPVDSTVQVSGTGNVKVQEGDNKLTVTATKGTETETYTINLKVYKKSAQDIKSVTDSDGKSVTNPDTGTFVNYALIGLGAGLCLFIVFKVVKGKKVYKI